MFTRIILGVFFVLSLVLAFGSAFKGSAAMVVLWIGVAGCLVVMISTREIVAAIYAASLIKPAPQPRPVSPSAVTPPAMSAVRPPEQVTGQLPGESLEAWAKRVEQEEAAAFKRRYR